MVALPEVADPTLAAIDRALEAKNAGRFSYYLGFSAIGKPCSRDLWYGFRWTVKSHFDAKSIKRFDDGNHGENVMAARLRLVPGIELHTIDPETGKQFGFMDHGGHYRGRCDGVVFGLLQAPRNWHVWEHKQTDDKNVTALARAKIKLGEKSALFDWSETYWAQAQEYMARTGFDRHYMTVSSAGARTTISVRTEANPEEAERITAKAGQIINAPKPPSKISDDPSWWQCNFCDHKGLCHFGEPPELNCRTCLHSTAVDGGWQCERHLKRLSFDEQRAACPNHLFIPDLVPGEQIDAGNDWIEYRMRDGSTWVNGAKA